MPAASATVTLAMLRGNDRIPHGRRRATSLGSGRRFCSPATRAWPDQREGAARKLACILMICHN